MSVYPRAFSHIGLSVPDIERSFLFYTEVLGFYSIMAPTKVLEDRSTAIGQMCIDVFGAGFGYFHIAHLSTVDKVGIEMFQFPQNKDVKSTFEPYRNGVFHFAIQDPDIEGLAKSIVAHGGKQRMPIRYYYPNEKPYAMVYMEDPFGNIIEIYTHSYELHYSSGVYK